MPAASSTIERSAAPPVSLPTAIVVFRSAGESTEPWMSRFT